MSETPTAPNAIPPGADPGRSYPGPAGDAPDLATRLQAAIEECRPMLQSDGGDIEFLGIIEGNRAKVRLVGACHGCPSSTATLLMGVENYIRELVPECEGLVAEGIGDP